MKLFYSCLFLFFVHASYSQPGTIDNSFGTAGIAHTNIGKYFTSGNINATLIQTDGKIIVAASASGMTGVGPSATLLRLNSNGSYDNTFNGNGTGSFVANVSFFGLALQTDGKIIAAGFTSASTGSDFAVARYNTDGSLDNTFNNSGVAYASIAAGNDLAYAVALQSDGKIVLAGTTPGVGAYTKMAFARFTSAGALDNSFNGTGTLTIPISSQWNGVKALAIQTDGKIVAAGYNFNGSNYEFSIVRLNSNGSLDNTFDSDGKASATMGTDGDEAYSIALQPDGKIIAAGSSASGNLISFGIARFNTNGSLDATFNGNGKEVTSMGAGNSSCYAVAVQSDGKIVTAGYNNASTNFSAFALARYNTNGSLDDTFDGDGIVQTSLSTSSEATALTLQSNGNILAAGNSAGGNAAGIQYTIVDYNENGSLNSGFASNGVFNQSPYTFSDDIAYGIAVAANGKIVTGGYTVAGGGRFAQTYYRMGVARYNADGSADNSYNSSGSTDYSIAPNADVVVLATIVQPDGKILTGGYLYNTSSRNYDFFVARFSSAGPGLDNTFGSNGYSIIDVSGSDDYAYAMALQPDGKILLAGDVYSGSRWNMGIVRLTAEGIPDVTFNSNGKEIISATTYGSFARSIAVKPDGKIVAGGYASTNSSGSVAFALAQLNANGSLDNSFNTTGIFTTNLNASNFDYAYSVAVQSDNKILLTGDTYNGSNYDMGVIRCNANGTLDNTFNGSGKLTFAFGSAADYARSIVVQIDGKIIVGGTTYNASGIASPTLARLTSAGSFDNTFGTGGKAQYNLNNGNSVTFTSMALGDFKIYMAGYSAYDKLNDFVVAAVQNDAALPLHLLQFTGQLHNKGTLLQWKTVNEVNASHFDVERSVNGREFSPIGNVTATNSTGENVYRYEDELSLSHTNYYRLKMIDKDGSFTYSNVILINISDMIAGFKIFPNPAESVLNLQLSADVAGKAIFKITDASGRSISEKTITVNPGVTSTSFEIENLPSGVYYFTAQQNGKTEMKTFIKK